jgi:TonB family protein
VRLSVASVALAVAFVAAPVAAGYAPAFADDFTITNEEPADAGRRDLMRQLQAWWDVHAYYPRHASNNDEGGTVKVHLVIQTDGIIRRVEVAQSSGSRSLDLAGSAVFNGGFVRPFPAGAPEADIDLSLHYILAHRHDQPVPVDYTPVPPKSPFTIANDPVKSPILETMLQRTCTGTIVREGIRNHPIYGTRSSAEAIFFRKPDGTPWVKFHDTYYNGSQLSLAPVTEVGKMVEWTGPAEWHGQGYTWFVQYTVWSDGDNKLSGSIFIDWDKDPGGQLPTNRGGTVDFTCATEVVPAIKWDSWHVNAVVVPPGDPP